MTAGRLARTKNEADFEKRFRNASSCKSILDVEPDRRCRYADRWISAAIVAPVALPVLAAGGRRVIRRLTRVPDGHVVVRGGTSEVPPPGQTFSGAAGRTLDEAASAYSTVRSVQRPPGRSVKVAAVSVTVRRERAPETGTTTTSTSAVGPERVHSEKRGQIPFQRRGGSNEFERLDSNPVP